MNEDFLQFLWKYRLYDRLVLQNDTSEEIRIISTGSHNIHSGPDFFNAKIKVGNELWAGNVEIHKQTSDWMRHNHHKDSFYDSVVLHVVKKHDGTQIFRTTGSSILCVEMHYNPELEERYLGMLSNEGWVACDKYIHNVEPFKIKQMMGRLLVERFSKRTQDISSELQNTSNSWEEVFYRFLVRSFGLSINVLPFELLAKSLPYKIILKHRKSNVQVEALLFGQAGLLQVSTAKDAYVETLCKEYAHLKNMYSLAPIDGSLWKFMRTRPQNFPTVRIAQLASLLCQNVNIFDKIIRCKTIAQFRDVFGKVDVSPYWVEHYVFGKASSATNKRLGTSFENLLIINLWLPFLFTYAHLNAMYDLKEQSLDLLDKMPFEKNSEIAKWKALGLPINSAFDSQALMQLKKDYCTQKRCLECTMGKVIVEKGGNIRN